MRRPHALAALAFLALLAAMAPACGGNDVPVASPTPTASPVPSASAAAPSPSLPPSPKPSPATLGLPSDAPTTFPDPLEPRAMPPDALVPPAARATTSWYLSPPADPLALVGVAWGRGADPFAQEHGFVVWERFDGQTPAWRAVYAFTDEPPSGVLGIRLSTGDLTADGTPDALTFEDMGGSGGCGTWRVISPTAGAASQIFRRQTCDTEVTNSSGTLKIREAVFAPGDSHCCPSSYRIAILRWDGRRWHPIQASGGDASP